MRSVRQESEIAHDEVTAAVLRQIGHHLKTAREERGASVAQIAEQLRIKRDYLSHLENGDVGRIPGRTYALGFLRTYADYLGYDGNEVVEQVKTASDALPASPRLEYRTPLPESRRPTLLLIGLSVVLVAGLYSGWLWYEQNSATVPFLASGPADTPPPATTAQATETEANTTEATPTEAANVEPETAAGTATASVAPSIEDAAALAATAVPAPSTPETDETAAIAALPDDSAGIAREGASASTTEAPTTTLPAVPDPPRPLDALAAIERQDAEEATADQAGADEADVAAIIDNGEAALAAAAAETNAAAAPEIDGVASESAVGEASPGEMLAALNTANGGSEVRTFGSEPAASRVALLANEASWIQVQSADRAYVWTRTLEPGDAFLVPDRDDLALWTGNAGGLQVIVNGTPMPALGDRGEVRRDVPLAVDQLRASLAVTP